MYKAEEIPVCKLSTVICKISIIENHQPDQLETLQIIRKLMKQN